VVWSAADLRNLLTDHGITTVLIGAHAANRYRLEVRHTVDVDFLASSLTGVADVLRSVGCTVREVSEDGETYLLSARIESTVIDLLLVETEYQRGAMSRAVDGVLTIEDVIIHKLIAGRPRDTDDIRSILSTGREFDESFVIENAKQWGVVERWNEARTSGRGGT
jgi:hypothetical protein